jgi:glycosyltransferase involved in cell wall biosynthesis
VPSPPRVQSGPPPTFSIVVAAYQAARTIAQAVESALTQTVPPHEVIVVDDGSTDGTGDALGSYLDKIVYSRQENRGAAAASNVGFRQATGDFVAILDADDVYEPERIEALTELAIQRPDLDILATDAHLESGDEVVARFFEETPFGVGDQKVEILERCFLACPAVRRVALTAAGGFEESLRIGYDWECWIRLLHGGSTAGAVDEPLLRYRIGGPSLTADRVAALRSRVRVLELASRLDLSAEERLTLERFLRRRRHRALMAEVEQALREQRADARHKAFRAALAPGMAPSLRIKAFAASIAPRMAARRITAIEAATGHTRVKRGVPRRTCL